MKTLPTQVRMIDVDSIKVFVHRAREKAGYEAMKESIRVEDLKIPIQVRDIRHLPPDQRRRPDGGLYTHELARGGEGRLTAYQDLKRKKIPSIVVKLSETELVGGFLAENMIRKPLPWVEKARLVKAEIDAGATVEEVSRKFVITVGHVYKFLRVLNKTARGLEEEVATLPLHEAGALTTLPSEQQTIVVEVLRESTDRQFRDVLRKAKEVTEKEGTLTKPALEQAIRAVGDDLSNLRKSLKLHRLHHALGPQNILTILEDSKLKAALTKVGVNLKRFEQLTAE